MSLAARPGVMGLDDGSTVLTFVEAPLPPEVDAMRVGGVLYAREVLSVDLPEGVAALRVRGTVLAQRGVK